MIDALGELIISKYFISNNYWIAFMIKKGNHWIILSLKKKILL
jgi:hypothetical protein